MISADEIASGRRLLGQGKMQEAQEAAERALAVDPALEQAWIILFDSWMARRAPAQALEAALRGVAAAPSSQSLKARLMIGRFHQGDFSAATTIAEALWAGRPQALDVLTMLGQVAASLDRHDLAKSAFERADAVRPDDPQLQFNLATSLRNFGDFAQAEALYDRVIQARPDDWEAYKNRSELRRQTLKSNHVSELQAALSRTGPDWRGAVMVNYALGKEEEDLGRFDRAFSAFDAGARLRRQRMTYSVEADLKRMDRIRTTFSAGWMSRRPEGFPAEGPIFIFGLPRAGSTLLERMLGAHSQVASGGELQDFGIAVMARAGGSPTTKELIERSAELDLSKLGQAYVASTASRRQSGRRLIDKLPGNFLYAGLIAAALPKAIMVHIHRDSRDAGFAMYKTLFKQAYPFSYDLAELGRYIVGYQALMAHWRSVLPGRICDVPYEHLVADPEAVLGRELEHCGLAFEADCLSFHTRPQASSTASSVQVRRPIYQSSVESWRRYEPHLAPLLTALGQTSSL